MGRVVILCIGLLIGLATSLDAAENAKDAKPAEKTWLTTPKDAWPLFRGNALGNGIAASPLPDEMKLIWKHSVPNGAFDATAAIVESVVYIGDLDGNYFALQLSDGKVLWTKKHEAGFSACAAVDDGTLYVGDIDGKFYAFDAKNGSTKWSYEASGKIYSANFNGPHVLFGAEDGTMHCLTRADGKLVWKFQIEDQIRCSPTIVSGRAFLVGCDGKLHIIDVDKGKEAAVVSLNSPAGSTAAASGDRIYFGTSSGEFLAVDWKKAEKLWSFQDRARQQPISASAALTDDAVYVAGEDRTLRAFKLDSNDTVWKLQMRAKLESSPVVVGQRLYLGGHDGKLHAVDRTTGKEVWNYETGGKLVASPAVASERLVISSDDGTVYCFGK
jgi:outer membrane protein assembly factor BamB